jgi:phosphatidylglycerophosphatase A
MNISYKISEFISTYFYIGKIKIAPGTFGSLGAFPLIYLIDYMIVKYAILIPLDGFSYVEQRFITIFVTMFVIIIALFTVGVITSNIYIEHNKTEDPKEIVIDEVVGQMLTSVLTLISVVFAYNSNFASKYQPWVIDFLCFFLLPFVLFRLCDIFKPWPIKWFDQNIKGGLGVMLDDVIAAIMASVLQYAIIFNFIQ